MVLSVVKVPLQQGKNTLLEVKVLHLRRSSVYVCKYYQPHVGTVLCVSPGLLKHHRYLSTTKCTIHRLQSKKYSKSTVSKGGI